MPGVITYYHLAACQCLINGRAAFFIVRALIGALEGGYYPGMVHFLTLFYTTTEMAPRLALLAAMNDVRYLHNQWIRKLTH